MTNSRKLFCITVMAGLLVFLVSATPAAAQGGPNIKAVGNNGVAAQLNVIFKTGPKGTQTATATTDASGAVGIPPGLLSPSKPHTKMIVYQCPDGTYIVAAGSPDPCPGRSKELGFFWWDTSGTVVINKDAAEGAGVTIVGGGGTGTSSGNSSASTGFGASGFPGAEVFLGYSLFREIELGENFNGGEGAVAYNVNNWLGLVGDFSGYGSSNANVFAYLFGAQINQRTEKFTVHEDALFGGARISGSSSGSSGGGGCGQITCPGGIVNRAAKGGLLPTPEALADPAGSENAFAMTLGGGVDYNVSHLFAIRLGQFDYVLTRFGGQSQNNLRYSAGVVFRFGGH